jgi:hypothetical protein
MEGRFALDRVIDTPVDQDALTWEAWTGPPRVFVALEVLLVEPRTFATRRSRREKGVDCLPMAKPVGRLTTRGSAATARAFRASPVAGSPHRRPRSLSLRRTGRSALELCEIEGTRWALAVDRSSRQYFWKVWTCFRGPRLWNGTFGSSTNSSRGESDSDYLSAQRAALRRRLRESSYLVDPASSHMLVSKIKPCMSKYKQICTVKLRMAH